MQIILKAVAGRELDVSSDVSSTVGRIAGARAASQIRVERVFPEGTPGQRGRLFSAELPSSIQQDLLARILSDLHRQGLVEFAETPKPREPSPDHE